MQDEPSAKTPAIDIGASAGGLQTPGGLLTGPRETFGAAEVILPKLSRARQPPWVLLKGWLKPSSKRAPIL